MAEEQPRAPLSTTIEGLGSFPQAEVCAWLEGLNKEHAVLLGLKKDDFEALRTRTMPLVRVAKILEKLAKAQKIAETVVSVYKERHGLEGAAAKKKKGQVATNKDLQDAKHGFLIPADIRSMLLYFNTMGIPWSDVTLEDEAEYFKPTKPIRTAAAPSAAPRKRKAAEKEEEDDEDEEEDEEYESEETGSERETPSERGEEEEDDKPRGDTFVVSSEDEEGGQDV